MKAVAIKKGLSREKAADFREMGILRCDACGEDFVVWHSPSFVDKAVADRQAHWLEKVLAEEHERDKKHNGPDRVAGLAEPRRLLRPALPSKRR
jgi:hypothetical protein